MISSSMDGHQCQELQPALGKLIALCTDGWGVKRSAANGLRTVTLMMQCSTPWLLHSSATLVLTAGQQARDGRAALTVLRQGRSSEAPPSRGSERDGASDPAARAHAWDQCQSALLGPLPRAQLAQPGLYKLICLGHSKAWFQATPQQCGPTLVGLPQENACNTDITSSLSLQLCEYSLKCGAMIRQVKHLTIAHGYLWSTISTI